MSGYTSCCSRGSPPVISTSGHSYRRTSATTSSSSILRPSVNAYGVSHHVHRRSHAVRRTNTHGRPACVDSPWMEWKISLMVNIGGRNLHCTRAPDTVTLHGRRPGFARPKDTSLRRFVDSPRGARRDGCRVPGLKWSHGQADLLLETHLNDVPERQ